MNDSDSVCEVDEFENRRWFLEYFNGDKYWYVDGKCHRVDGPAVEYANGNRAWYQCGKLHRVDGPAVEYANGNGEWWFNGERFGGTEFLLDVGVEKVEGGWGWFPEILIVDGFVFGESLKLVGHIIMEIYSHLYF